MKKIIIAIIRAYQRTVSSVLPPRCRFIPTCSQYAIEAVDKYGPARGAALATKRLLRCHPFSDGGHDPLK
ncbi:MAG: membrane protein insertion efficiency factor YidD [Actinomycetota bacterium]|nr:membrane protein insertion efficiency factor YidD [Actinomycetota bacterium]